MNDQINGSLCLVSESFALKNLMSPKVKGYFGIIPSSCRGRPTEFVFGHGSASV